MKCTDQQFTNKHLLKQFFRAQDYFQDIAESCDLSQILIDIANEIEIKSYNKNTFLFHYDKEEYYDWFIILKGKASFYLPKTQQEVGLELNLLKQRDVINEELDGINLLMQSRDQKDKLRQLQLKKQEVEDAISQISSSKYDYIFQKYPTSYYLSHPQILSFKFSGYAGNGYVFDQINSDQPISAFIEEDSIIGSMRNEQYTRIFQRLQGDKKIINQALKKIQQKQDLIYYMKQVKDQHNITSPRRSEIQSLSQEIISKQQVEACDNFQQFVDNIPRQLSEQQKEFVINSPVDRGTRTINNFENNLQKEVKDLLKKQSSYKFGGNDENDVVTQKQKQILQSISNATSPKEYHLKEESPMTRNSEGPIRQKSESLRGSFLDLINSQKHEIEKQSFLVQSSEKIESKKQQGLISLKKVQSVQLNNNNAADDSPSKQVNFNVEHDEDDEYVRELDLLISKELSANKEQKQLDQPIQTKLNCQEGVFRKPSSSCHQKFTNNQFSLLQAIRQSEKLSKNETDPVKSSNSNSPSSFGDIFQQRIASDGTNLRGKTKVKQQQNSMFSQKSSKSGKDNSNMIDIFAFSGSENQKEQDFLHQHISNDATKQDSEEIKNMLLGSSDSKQNSTKKSRKEEIKNLYPHIFQKARILSTQLQQTQNQLYKELKQKNQGVDIESAEDHVQQKYLLQSSTSYNQHGSQGLKKQYESRSLKNSIHNDQISGAHEQLSHFLNFDQMSTLQSSQEAMSAKASLQVGGSPFQKQTLSQFETKKNNNSSSLRDIIQNNKSLASTLTSGWTQFNISPNLLEKRKSYADNIRTQHKRFMGRTHSQPSIHHNVSPVSSITNSPNSSAKNIKKNIPQQRLSFTSAIQYSAQEPSSNTNIPQNTNKSPNNSSSSIQEHPVEQYKKNFININKNHHYSSPQQSAKINVQRSASSLGFQTPQQSRVERPTSSGFKGKKIQISSKYSFISAFPNGSVTNIQMNAEGRRQTPNTSGINQGRNSIDYGNEEISYQANESMRVSIAKDGVIQIAPLQQSITPSQNNNFEMRPESGRRLNSAGQQNRNQYSIHSMKAIGLELNKQAQHSKVSKAIVYSRLQSAKQSNAQNTNSVTTQSQIQKDLLKSKAANSKIIKGSIVTKLTPEQSSLISSLSSSQPQNSDKKSVGNQLQDNSIRQEILTSLQRKIDIKQTSFIKLQSCTQNKPNQNQQSEGDKSGEIFSDKLIKLQEMSSTPEKISSQKPILVNQMISSQKNKPDFRHTLVLKQSSKKEEQEQQQEEEEEDVSSEQLKDEHYLLKMIQERENDSPENYIGFKSEKLINDNKDYHNDYPLPNFGLQKAKSTNATSEMYKMGNNSFGACEQVSKEEEIEDYIFYNLESKLQNNKNNNTNSNNKNKQKPISNTDGGTRHKSILKNKQQVMPQQQMEYLELPEQVTLGQNSNEDFFNVSSEHIQQVKSNEQPHIQQKQTEFEDLNTQTFQKRKNSQNVGNRMEIGKQGSISETPKFTFQII